MFKSYIDALMNSVPLLFVFVYIEIGKVRKKAITLITRVSSHDLGAQ